MLLFVSPILEAAASTVLLENLFIGIKPACLPVFCFFEVNCVFLNHQSMLIMVQIRSSVALLTKTKQTVTKK